MGVECRIILFWIITVNPKPERKGFRNAANKDRLAGIAGRVPGTRMGRIASKCL